MFINYYFLNCPQINKCSSSSLKIDYSILRKNSTIPNLANPPLYLGRRANTSITRQCFRKVPFLNNSPPVRATHLYAIYLYNS